MTNKEILNTAKQVTLNHLNSLRPAQLEAYTIDDVYIVWFCKTIQNWKALLSTDVVSGMYYELTYNGDKDELYMDIYSKYNKIVIPYREGKIQY